ncbi:MAG: hypothetical protein ACR2OH_01720 [Microthrixaceae bacterium]
MSGQSRKQHDGPSRRCPSLIPILALVATLIAASCGSSNSDGEPDAAALPEQETTTDPVQGGKLVYGLAGESNGRDPAGGTGAPWSFIAARAIFDTLTVFD